MTVAGMKIEEYYPLEVADFEEPEEPVGLDETFRARKKRSHWHPCPSTTFNSISKSGQKERQQEEEKVVKLEAKEVEHEVEQEVDWNRTHARCTGSVRG